MLDNLIGNFAAKFIGKKLDGYKLKIGAVCSIIYLLLTAISKIFPDLGLEVADKDWSGIISGVTEAVTYLTATGAVVLVPVGAAAKAYKVGLNTPVPVPVTEYKPIPITEPEAPKKWDGKVGGQFP